MQLFSLQTTKNKIIELQSMLPENITIRSLESIGCFEDIPET
jgi:XTP/dITP diphosphohydrolase